MKSGYSVDLFLLKKFQNISDQTQDYFGYNNFAIAKFLRAIMVIAFILREIISFTQGIDAPEFIVIACSVTILVKMEFMSYKAQENLKSKHEFMNPVVAEYATTRIIIQFVSIAAFGFLLKHLSYVLTPSLNIMPQYGELKELCWDVFGILLFFVVYFNSCTPKPYKPGKLKKLFTVPVKT